MIQDYIEYIIKSMKHCLLILLVIFMSIGLILQTPETIKLSVSTKKLMDKTKNGENVPSFDIVEVGQASAIQKQFNIVYSFMSNKSYAYLLTVEPSNVLFLKTCNRV